LQRESTDWFLTNGAAAELIAFEAGCAGQRRARTAVNQKMEQGMKG
jgi:hypothetical protein